VPALNPVLLSQPDPPQPPSIHAALWTCPSAHIWTETYLQKVAESMAADPPSWAEGPAALPLASKEGHGETSPEGFPLQCSQPGKAQEKQIWLANSTGCHHEHHRGLCPEPITASCLVKQVWPSVPNTNK